MRSLGLVNQEMGNLVRIFDQTKHPPQQSSVDLQSTGLNARPFPDREAIFRIEQETFVGAL